MKGPVQLPDGRFAKLLFQNDNGEWEIQVTSKKGRGERDAYPARMLKRVDPGEWSKISARRPNKQAPRTMQPAHGACPQCQTPPPSYRSGVSCPNCEYREHSFKQWLEDTTSSMGAYGNAEDPDEYGLKRHSYLSRAVPGSEMADKIFGVKYMAKLQPTSIKRSSKRRKSSRPVPCNRRRPNSPRT